MDGRASIRFLGRKVRFPMQKRTLRLSVIVGLGMAGLLVPGSIARAQGTIPGPAPAPTNPQPAADPNANAPDASKQKAPDVLDKASKEKQLSRFVDAVKAAGLTDMLKGDGPYTILAPTNSAFSKLPAGTLDDLMKPENKSKLADLLRYHIVAGNFSSADILKMGDKATLKTLAGTNVTLNLGPNPKLNDAGLIKTDIMASNGVIHIIDSVLMPPSVTAPVDTTPPAVPPATPPAVPPANP
jgi:uncharacterized surface protein with fasciclin (FAS1) repeats